MPALTYEEGDALIERVCAEIRSGAFESEDALRALAARLAEATHFAVAADLYQRPDRYVFAGSPLGHPDVDAFLEALFVRLPDTRTGELARLYAYHREVRVRP